MFRAQNRHVHLGKRQRRQRKNPLLAKSAVASMAKQDNVYLRIYIVKWGEMH